MSNYQRTQLEFEMYRRARYAQNKFEVENASAALDGDGFLLDLDDQQLELLLAKTIKEEFEAIYGTDDRDDYFSLSSQRRNEIDNWSVVIVDRRALTDNPNGTTTINARNYVDAEQDGITLPLCAGTRFLNQPQAGVCSGILLGRRNVLTASHCFEQTPFAQFRVVFGFRMNAAALPITTVPTTQTANFEELWFRNSDVAVLRLDRIFTPPTLPRRRREGSISRGARIYIMGYPDGLPVKVSANATVGSVGTNFFMTNLDAFHGNSGSPVFAEDGTIEGILSSGNIDYANVGACYQPAVYANGSFGERCSSITLFNQFEAFAYPPLAAGKIKPNAEDSEMLPVCWDRKLRSGLLLDVNYESGETSVYRYDQKNSESTLSTLDASVTLGGYEKRMRLIPIVHNETLIGLGESKFVAWQLNADRQDNVDVRQVSAGRFTSIGKSHRFCALPWNARFGTTRVLEWNEETGDYWIWRHIEGANTPFSDTPINQGVWPESLVGRQLTPISRYSSKSNLVLDWEPRSGDFRVWEFDQASCQFSRDLVKRFFFEDVFENQRIVGLWEPELLAWQPDVGSYRVFAYNHSVAQNRGESCR